MVRVRPSPFTPQPQVLVTDLLASIKELGKLSKGPGYQPRPLTNVTLVLFGKYGNMN